MTADQIIDIIKKYCFKNGLVLDMSITSIWEDMADLIKDTPAESLLIMFSKISKDFPFPIVLTKSEFSTYKYRYDYNVVPVLELIKQERDEKLSILSD
jgi:hypothetical protein